MQFRYTVGAEFKDSEMAEAWLAWLRNGHIAEVLAGGATDAEVVRLDGGPNRFEVTYHFPSREAFAIYERDHAPRLRAEGVKLFPPDRGVVYRRTTGEVIKVFEKEPRTK